MPRRDMISDLSPVTSILPVVATADNTEISVDIGGYEAATILLQVGAGGITFTTTNKIEFVLTHSDDNSNFTAVTAADLVGAPTVATGGIILAFTAVKAAASIHEFGYVGNKRYLKLLADFGGTHGTGTAIAAVVLRGLPLKGPVT